MPVKKKSITRGKSITSTTRTKTRDTSGTHSTRGTSLSVPVYSLAGRASGNITLPKEIFGVIVNQKLLSQAVRVYQTAQKTLLGNTKTRGEVQGSTAKIFRQKGTGRARHGSVRAPIFVGGGIVFGPRTRRVKLDLPQKMRNKALISALSLKAKDKDIVALSGIEKATGKTKEIANLIDKLKIKSALFVTADKLDNVVRGVRNIPGMSITPSNQLNAYEVLKYKSLLITKDAIEKFSGKGAKK